MDGESPILKVENVVKDFGGLKAVNGVSLGIEKGEIRGLIGPNGSGKTTLINLITGIYKVTGGPSSSPESGSMAYRPTRSPPSASCGPFRFHGSSRT